MIDDVKANWRDVKSYDYMKTFSLCDWGWEFIRRDSRYIKEWESEFEKFKNSKSKGKFTLDDLLISEFDFLTEIQDFNSYTKLLEETDRTNSEDFFKFIIPSKKASKWGLRHYQNPKSMEFNKSNLLSDKIVFIGTDPVDVENEAEISLIKHLNSLIVQIDLERAVVPQIEKLKKIAQEQQNQINQKRQRSLKVTDYNINLWIKYLRIIDAQNNNISRKESSSIIFSNLLPKEEWSDPNVPVDTLDNAKTQIAELSIKDYKEFMQ